MERDSWLDAEYYASLLNLLLFGAESRALEAPGFPIVVYNVFGAGEDEVLDFVAARGGF
ncbi:hypothetical protein BH24DEI1_BH24DEI1_04960 [soil metagenome]|nr:hypothetical protein [Deinococcota bacterium]